MQKLKKNENILSTLDTIDNPFFQNTRREFTSTSVLDFEQTVNARISMLFSSFTKFSRLLERF